MSGDDWKAEIKYIHETVLKHWPPYSDEDRRFLVLALSGEVGELGNIVKKEWRGDFSFRTGQEGFKRASALVEELADIRIYLELVALAYGVDLDAAVQSKLPELYRRWPETITP